MKEIQVILQTYTERGQLLYRPDAELRDRLFYIKSPLYQHQTYQVATNEPILFSLDFDGLLVAVEFIIPRIVWRVTENVMRLPEAPLVSLAFSEETIRHESFDLDADVTANSSYSFVFIRLGSYEENADWVALSEHCLVLIAEDRLKGLYIRLV